MKTLITGGAGFIGKHVLNSVDSGVSFDLHKINDADIIGNLNNEQDIDLATKDKDCVLHLAAISRVSDCQENPQKCINVNILGTVNVLEASVKNGVKLFGLISTGEVTWIQNNDEIKSFKPIDNIYGVSKLTDELILDIYCKEHDLQGIIFRISSVVFGGTDDNQKKVLPIFINKALKGEDITVNNINSKWDFIHVSDVAKKINDNIQKPTLDTNKGLKEVEITSGVVLNLLDLAKIIHFLVKSTSKIKYINTEINNISKDMFNKIVDNNKVNTNFIKNLESTIAEYKRK